MVELARMKYSKREQMFTTYNGIWNDYTIKKKIQ